jgi:hypothetical protein
LFPVIVPVTLASIAVTAPAIRDQDAGPTLGIVPSHASHTAIAVTILLFLRSIVDVLRPRRSPDARGLFPSLCQPLAIAATIPADIHRDAGPDVRLFPSLRPANTLRDRCNDTCCFRSTLMQAPQGSDVSLFPTAATLRDFKRSDEPADICDQDAGPTLDCSQSLRQPHRSLQTCLCSLFSEASLISALGAGPTLDCSCHCASHTRDHNDTSCCSQKHVSSARVRR